MAHKQWYFLANTTFKYHLTLVKAQQALCDAKCGHIGQNVSFAPFDYSLFKFGQLKSAIMWVEHINLCSYTVNGEVVKSKNCTYIFRCLCRQKTKNFNSRSYIVQDKRSQKNQGMNFRFSLIQ